MQCEEEGGYRRILDVNQSLGVKYQSESFHECAKNIAIGIIIVIPQRTVSKPDFLLE